MADRVTSMPTVSVTEDGTLIETVFRSDSGVLHSLQFSTADFGRFMAHAGEIFASAQTRRSTTTDHLENHAVQAVDASAQAPVGGGRVLILLRGDNNMPFHFSLSPATAEKLRPELYRAMKSALKQASRPRH